MAEQAVSRVTEDELVAGLRGLGLQAGDVALVHASLSRFGHVVGGAPTVIAALLEALGPQGTLAMPGFTFYLNEVPAPVFDVLNSPCWTSKVYELFRTRHATHRSHHCTHSVCACGARAAELTATHSTEPCGAQSPFRKLVKWEGKILFLGVGHNCNTTFHAVEEQEGLFYCQFRDLPGAAIIDEREQRCPLPTRVHAPLRRYDFNRMDKVLRSAGIQRQGLIGDAIVRCVEAKAMFDLAVKRVRQDPEALLQQGEERVELAVCRSPHR